VRISQRRNCGESRFRGTLRSLLALHLKLGEEMKKPVVFLVPGAIIVALFVLAGLSALAAIPHLINYQGMLTDAGGDSHRRSAQSDVPDLR